MTWILFEIKNQKPMIKEKPIHFSENMISLLVPCSTQYSIPACVAAIHYVFTACFSMDLVLRYTVFKPMFMSAGFIYVLLAKTTPLGLLHSTLRSYTALPSSLIFFNNFISPQWNWFIFFLTPLIILTQIIIKGTIGQ